MGSGYSFRCKNCGKKYNSYKGVGPRGEHLMTIKELAEISCLKERTVK